jgi:predicted nuclease with TOPRIM domain
MVELAASANSLANVVLALVAVVPVAAVALYAIRRFRSAEWESLAKSRGEALSDARSDLADERRDRQEDTGKLRAENSRLRERVSALEAEVAALKERTDVAPLVASMKLVLDQLAILAPLVKEIHEAATKA